MRTHLPPNSQFIPGSNDAFRSQESFGVNYREGDFLNALLTEHFHPAAEHRSSSCDSWRKDLKDDPQRLDHYGLAK